MATGPFGNPAEPFERLVIPLQGRGAEWIPNAIWDYRNMLLGFELCRLWEFVFHEICDQHAAIDCEEHSNVALALMALSPWKRANAASALGRHGTERAVPYLRQVASEPVTTDDLKSLQVWVLEACQRLERRLVECR